MMELLQAIESRIKPEDCEGDSLFAGKLGLVIYYCCLSRVVDKSFLDTAETLFCQVIESVNNNNTTLQGYPYANGLTGLAFVAAFLQQENYLALDMEELLKSLDKSLFECAREDISRDQTDFLYQAGGVLHYFSYRQANQEVNEFVSTLVTDLANYGMRDERGFRTVNGLLEKGMESVDFGLAHGMSGLLMILCNLFENGKGSEVAKQLLQEGARYIASCKFENHLRLEKKSLYPVFTSRDGSQPIESNRLAWCYGDLTILLLLYRLLPILGDTQLLEEADALGSAVLCRQDLQENAIADAHFCHGASGVAQMYRAIYRASGDERYRSAYEYWLGITTKMLGENLMNHTFLGKEVGLLEGLLGPALVLLSSISEEDLAWDKLLLVA